MRTTSPGVPRAGFPGCRFKSPLGGDGGAGPEMAEPPGSPNPARAPKRGQGAGSSPPAAWGGRHELNEPLITAYTRQRACGGTWPCGDARCNRGVRRRGDLAEPSRSKKIQ